MTNDMSCGFIAIVGEPNAGKSTLINRLTGGKISIVSPKMQTTRFNVRGICAECSSQLIFVDTPGIFDAGKPFEKAMVQAAWAGMGDADAVLLLLDARYGLKDSTKALFDKLKERNCKPIFLVINKIDLVDKAKLFELAKACDTQGIFTRIFMISALKGDGTDDIKSALAAYMPRGPWLYPKEQMSDISMRLLAAEITREKLFMKLDQELPYAVFVETETWDESDARISIAQVILVQREGQKKIVIGDKGSMIKQIGISARKELERLTGKKIHLELFVKVKPNWKDDSESYRLLGLEFRR